jgi:hypothetical protein
MHPLGGAKTLINTTFCGIVSPMDTYPSNPEYTYTPDQPLTFANVADHISYMHTLEPRGEAHDEAMRKLYDYIEEEADGVMDTTVQKATFFDREVAEGSQLAEAIVAAAQQVQAAVMDRGRGHHGQKGDYFWYGAEDIEEQRKRLTPKLWTIAEQHGVTVDTWYKEVMTYKG